jgi:hypothetical protein
MCRQLRTEIEAALKGIEAKFGVTVNAGNAKYSPTEGWAKFNLEILPKGKESLKAVQAENTVNPWTLKMYGLPETLKVGDNFMGINGQRYKFTGINTRNRRFPILCEQGNRKFKVPAAYVKNVLVNTADMR